MDTPNPPDEASVTLSDGASVHVTARVDAFLRVCEVLRPLDPKDRDAVLDLVREEVMTSTWMEHAVTGVKEAARLAEAIEAHRGSIRGLIGGRSRPQDDALYRSLSEEARGG